jgi:hypothetical protein
LTTETHDIVLCPRCKIEYYQPYGDEPSLAPIGVMPPALSRADNETYICSHCGTDEAMLNFKDPHTPLAQPRDWPVTLP